MVMKYQDYAGYHVEKPNQITKLKNQAIQPAYRDETELLSSDSCKCLSG